MNSKRLFYLMNGLVVLAVLVVIGGTYEINSLLGKQSQQLVAAKAKLSSLDQQQIELAQAKKDIKTYNNLYQIARTIVPESKNQAEAVRQIVNLAKASGVTIGSITFPPSTLGGGTSSAAAPASASGPSAAGGANPSLSQLQKVTNIPGVYVLQLVVQSSTSNNSLATYQELINFLSGLEQNRLTALVSTISIVPSANGGGGSQGPPTSFTFQLTLNIYIKP